MSRKFVFLLVFFLFSYAAQSQVLISLLLGDNLNTGKIEFGLDGGLTFSSLSGTGNAEPMSSFNLGFYFDIKTKKETWLIHTGVIVKSTLGAEGLPVYSLDQPDLDKTYEGGSVERRLSYFHVPFLMKYRSRNHWFAEGGIMLALLYKAKDTFHNTVQGNEVTCERDIRDGYHPLDAGLMGGLGYRLLKGYGMNLGVRYFFGLVDVTLDDTGGTVANRALYFTVGIPIGAGKAAERRAEKATGKEVK